MIYKIHEFAGTHFHLLFRTVSNSLWLLCSERAKVERVTWISMDTQQKKSKRRKTNTNADKTRVLRIIFHHIISLEFDAQNSVLLWFDVKFIPECEALLVGSNSDDRAIIREFHVVDRLLLYWLPIEGTSSRRGISANSIKQCNYITPSTMIHNCQLQSLTRAMRNSRKSVWTVVSTLLLLNSVQAMRKYSMAQIQAHSVCFVVNNNQQID